MSPLRAAHRLLRSFWTGLLDLAYPPCCLHCRSRTPTGKDPLCSRCLQGLERASASSIMEHVARLPAPTDALDHATALWRFDKDGALQQVQHALKYGNRPQYGVILGKLMAACIDEPAALDAIVPIPLHRVRRYERGYNQSAMLARGLAAEIHVPVRADWLVRSRPTRSQARLARTQRWNNVANAFEVPHPAAVRDTHLLLVDDILTTGSTAVAAAAALKAAGAARVDLCTLAFARG